MKGYTNTQRYILAGLLAGGFILKVSRAMSSWNIRSSYKFVGPDGETKCTVDTRTFERFLRGGIIKEQKGKWISVLTPPEEAEDDK